MNIKIPISPSQYYRVIYCSYLCFGRTVDDKWSDPFNWLEQYTLKRGK